YAPLVVGENGRGGGRGDIARALRVDDLDLPGGVSERRADDRLGLLDDLNKEFLAERPGGPAVGHRTAYQRAVTMMRSTAIKAFDLDEEPAKLRDRYGRNLFGQGCLLARRLVEKGVPFVEVSLGGWDTHGNNFEQVKRLCGTLDPAWSTLMGDLAEKGLL